MNTDRKAKRLARLIERWKNVERVLKGLTAHQRKRHWDMTTWGRETDCGTIACAAGHCSLDPWFKEHGFAGEVFQQTSAFGGSYGIFQINGKRFWGIGKVVKRYFGAEGAEGVFMNHDLQKYDDVLKAVRKHLRHLKRAYSAGDTSNG